MTEASDSFLSVLRAERQNLLGGLRKTRFSSLKTGISHSQIIPFASYSPWLDDEAFMRLFKAVSNHTLVDIYRCHELYSLALRNASVPGDVVEVGVWRGGTAALLACAAPEKTAHLFDTFQGVVKSDARFDTFYQDGEHADTDQETVKALFSSLGINCRIHCGMFPDDTLDGLPEKVSLAHLDVDTYGSVRQSFYAIWPRVQPRGVIIFDDYGQYGCEGATQAINEIVAAVTDGFFMHNLNGHALLVKQA